MSEEMKQEGEYKAKSMNRASSKGDGEGKDATVLMPEYGTETHGSPASKGGIAEDEGKC